MMAHPMMNSAPSSKVENSASKPVMIVSEQSDKRRPECERQQKRRAQGGCDKAWCIAAVEQTFAHEQRPKPEFADHTDQRHG